MIRQGWLRDEPSEREYHRLQREMEAIQKRLRELSTCELQVERELNCGIMNDPQRLRRLRVAVSAAQRCVLD
jgi:hypothetical protein